ncbi:hypothetical protein [Paracoccus sp. SY]|uniref:hypothetical protein n=1 Tax=Paracoccus sp. SY TaxID=1330255 RepID=UPI0018640937|nr:hypothetical protein [Paracoccus sp. SY]
MFPAEISSGQTSLLLFDHPDNLRLGEPAFPYFVCSSGDRLYMTAREFREQVKHIELVGLLAAILDLGVGAENVFGHQKASLLREAGESMGFLVVGQDLVCGEQA